MKRRLTTLTAALAASAGLMRYFHDSKGTVKKSIRSGISNVNRAVNTSVAHLSNSYRRATPTQKQEIKRTLDLIIPKADYGNGLWFPANILQYIRILRYLQDRYEFHAIDAARRLSIPLPRVKQLTIALARQGLLEHTEAGANYIRRNKAHVTFKRVKRQADHDRVNVNTKRFINFLKNNVAFNVLHH